MFRNAGDAIEIARYDDAGNYRPLKTAPNLRHGWRMELGTMEELKRASRSFLSRQVGRLRRVAARPAAHHAARAKHWIGNRDVSYRRQNSRMRRLMIWSRIFAGPMVAVCGQSCGSATSRGAIASTKLPKEKFDPTWDQVQAAYGLVISPSLKLRADTDDPGYSPAALPGGVQPFGRGLPESSRKPNDHSRAGRRDDGWSAY